MQRESGDKTRASGTSDCQCTQSLAMHIYVQSATLSNATITTRALACGDLLSLALKGAFLQLGTTSSETQPAAGWSMQ